MLGDGMGPSTNHNANVRGGTGLIDDGSTGAEMQPEDENFHSMPASGHGHRRIPSGLIDDGSYNPAHDHDGGKLFDHVRYETRPLAGPYL